ncbi:uncharacterized protein N7498_008303 [Penicillium cinerascens]|uniref:Deoxyribonuclease NucA/NucB domain-containing protein n=1 Tax=Penicillium cinerascens TaxID=70096 RepID=A0A9W9JH83_9EURO|nr:uncharacterized protein N7498_008303 [Penicillium cinerascens]KAJ5194865.1 hypothetical protein N7498_008303 [Penicillium cinerascens]
MSFGKAEVFWPQDEDVQEKYTNTLGLESKTESPSPGEVEPVFHAGLGVDAQIDVVITPQANVGIKIGGGSLVGGKTLMDAQLSGYVDTDLSFQAHGDYDTSDNAFHYRLGTYLYYNVGYKAKAKILGFIDWATGDREAYSPAKMIKLYENTGTTPMSAPDVDKRGVDSNFPQLDMFSNSTMSVLTPGPAIFRRADVDMGATAPLGRLDSDYQNCDVSSAMMTGFLSSFHPACLPLTPYAFTFFLTIYKSPVNCAWLSRYLVINDVLDAYGNPERLTYEVPGLCDGIVKLDPLWTKFTYSREIKGGARVEKRHQSVCTDTKCSVQETNAPNKAVRRKNLKLQCDEFPWASTEQGGTWLPQAQRRTECVPTFQNTWHGNCVKMMGEFTSNWKQLDPEPRSDSEMRNYWVPWRSTYWETAGDFPSGTAYAKKYQQQLQDYGEPMPPPDGGIQNGNNQVSWAFKRDYETSWIQPQSSLTSADWWGANKPSMYTPTSVGPLDMDSILCAVNHFNQEDVYKLPGRAVNSDGTDQGAQKPYNAYCKKTSGSGIKPDGWTVQYNVARCLVRFANSQSSSSGASKRDAQTWNGWEIESPFFRTIIIF